MKSITIQVPDMQSSHCQLRVNKAITSVDGAKVPDITPGKAIVTIENDAQKTSVVRAINEAGYKTMLMNEDQIS